MSVPAWLGALLVVAVATPAARAADHYTLDPEHTYPSFEMSHMDISVWRGKFNGTSGTVTLDRAARTGEVEIRVEAASIDFGHALMNEHAAGADWLNAAAFPTLSYRGRLRFKGDAPVRVDGELTLRGVTRPLSLAIRKFRCIEHPYYKKEVCGADAEGELNRADFGMTQYSEGEAGKIRLRIQVEAFKDVPKPAQYAAQPPVTR